MIVSGIDMIEIARIEGAIERHGQRFYDRFFTPREVELCQGKASRLAGRFAVKEAVAKAMGTGIGDFNWTDIEIIGDSRGKPELRLHNQARIAAEERGLFHWSITLSHTETYAIGMAVALAGSFNSDS